MLFYRAYLYVYIGIGILLNVGLVAGCSSGGSVQADGAVADLVSLADTRPDSPASGDLQLPDAPPDLYLWPDLATPDAPSPSTLQEIRGLIHMHSIYSHDGCDGEGFINGQPNTQCLKELRDAICENKLDFVALTDHPANMKDYTMKEDMLYDASAGDQLVMHQGKPIANRITCSNGTQSLISVGFEAKHMMPLGLFDLPPADNLYDGIDDNSDLTTVKQQVQALKALGAVAAMVHSEEPDISASTIDAAGFEAMEWYNIHANFSALIGSDLISVDPNNIAKLGTLVNKLVGMGPFMSGGAGSPHPDLVYLLFLDLIPKEGFDKWRAVQQARPISGILGSDIHRNVNVDPGMCGGVMQLVCVGALALVESTLGVTIPQMVKSALLQGGTLNLSDGERIDSYQRLMRWMENRVLVQSKDQLQILDALRAGRSYGLFSIFGAPHLFSFTAQDSGGNTLQIGDAGKGPLTLEVHVPDRPEAMGVGGVSFSSSEGLKAEVRARLLRVDSAGTTQVHEETALGATISQQVTQPGAYYVEIHIKPKHLSAALGSASDLANKEYLWVISNPIHLTP